MAPTWAGPGLFILVSDVTMNSLRPLNYPLSNSRRHRYLC